MSIEIIIKADALAAAIEKLADAITVRASIAKVNGGELQIPAGTPLTVTGVVKATAEPAAEPEKPKRKRVSKQAAEMLAESTQEPAGEPEAPQAVTTPAEPEKPAEAPWETVADSPAAAVFAAENKPAPTMEQIATAGARLLDTNPNAMDQLIALLGEYGAQAITQLKADQLGGFADRMRALGAEV